MKNYEAMKNQTFGVEVEMNHITRERAAALAAEFFGTGRYAYTDATDGYRTWSAYDQQGRKWKFSHDSSIHGIESQRCELVTPILTCADMDTLQELVRVLRRNGAVSNAQEGCGIHVHVGANGHTPQTLRNLVNIMASHEAMLVSALKLDMGRVSTYCRTVDQRFLKAVNREKPATMAELADVWYHSQNCDYGRTQHYNCSRYHMLNLHATFTKGTIEFRLFQFDNPTEDRKGGIHAGQLKSYIQLCLALSQQAKEVKTASAKVQETNNPKYAMRTWLLRLGFIGDEFKTAREILTRNLEGNAAWRMAA